MQRPTYLITGVSGFVGSHLHRALAACGVRVLGVVSASETRRVPLDDISILQRDLAKDGLLVNDFDGENIHGVIHCAARQPRAALTFRDYYQGNVLPLMNVYNWMMRRGIKRLLTFSSVAVYGDPKGKAITEESLIGPTTEYALSKWVADQWLRICAREIVAVTLRLPSVFGPDQHGGLIDTYYDAAAAHGEIELYAGGRLKRNLVHIDDVVRAVETVIAKWGDVEGCETFLVGSSNSLTTKEIARQIVDSLNSGSQLRPVETVGNVAIDWILDLSKAAKVLGFKPRSIEDGIDLYVKQRRELHG